MSEAFEGMLRSIVIVDDDRNDRELLAEVLQEAKPGQPILSLGTAEELMTQLDGEGLNPPPALFLMDIALPGLSGLGLLAELRKRSDTAHVPMVMLSGTAEPVVVDRAYALGASSFLVKPDDLSALREMAATIASYWLSLNRGPRFRR